MDAIHQKRTLTFLNHFITHTTNFLNRFSNICEEKLEAVSVRLQRLETIMAIVEAKVGNNGILTEGSLYRWELDRKLKSVITKSIRSTSDIILNRHF